MSLINKMNVGNTNYDIQDRLMPDAIGQAGQVLKVKDDGSGLEFSTIKSSSGKLYVHYIYFNNATNFPTLVFYSTSLNRVTDKWIYDNLANKYNLTIFPTITSITAFGGIGLTRKIMQTSSSPSWGANINLSSPSPITLSVSEATIYNITEV